MQEIEIQVGQEDHPHGFGWLLWACAWPPFESHGGGFDGLHMFGGTHPGDRRNSMVHRGSYLWQYHGAKMVRPKTGGEKNITRSRTGLSDRRRGVLQFLKIEV